MRTLSLLQKVSFFAGALIALLFFPGMVFGQTNYSLDFDGGTDHVVLGGDDFPPPWTLEVMVNKSETDNYQHLLTSTDGNSGIRLEQYWGTKVGFTKSGYADWYFNYVAPIGQWIQVTITNNGSETKLYIDGVYNSSVNASIDFPMKWISKPNEDASLKAKIDELRIWNKVLSDDVIAQYAGQPVDDTHPDWDNLLHYYKFDEGSGNICYDSKGDLDGIIHGATYYIDTNHDAGVKELVAPENTTDNYSSEEPLIVKVKNYGFEEINESFTVSYTLEGVLQQTVTIHADEEALPPGGTIDVSFDPIDLNTSGTYHFKFYTSLDADENHSNDTLTKTLISNSHVVGPITAFEADSNTALITCAPSKVKVIFYKDDMFRIWLAPNGTFTNPAGDNIVVSYDYPGVNINWTDEGDYYAVTSSKLELRAYKNPLRFELYDNVTKSQIWSETSGLDYGTRTFQYLNSDPDEYFYGGGMQNGYFSHKGTKIKISKETQNWDDGAVPNPVPFYMSTKGYGAFRNTFAKGVYDFTNPNKISTAHKENRFDCFYFYGPSLKEVLNGYTELTGRSLFPPRWGLELGDADCYNKDGHTTPDVIPLVADKYREYDLPGGWILPNDGYGCGYTDLPYVVEQLHQRGFYTGLWTENGVDQIAWEVGTAGTRLCKLDVAWVGSGYLNALNACKAAYTGIEDNCNERGYVWSVCGWAGTQRYSVVWSGDQYGGFEYIRFHIPTFIGSGLSGYNLASSDLDGIFGGGALSYARDIQWKTFIPVFYAMSGWAPHDKHPWNYGNTVMNISRDYLKLKLRLTPYMYTYVREAHDDGTPVVRAMVLEFPDDPVTWGKTTQYQFMSGEWMLVAPVYQQTEERDSIYFPQGKFIDYWDGQVYEGPMFLNDYPAPLSKCPVFIKEGAIIPMYTERLYDSQMPKDTVTYDVYPSGNTSFEMYEDDGVTREYKNGAFAKTLIECEAPEYGSEGTITITVNATQGDYLGKPAVRTSYFDVHVNGKEPVNVLLNGAMLQQYQSEEDFQQAEEGWYFAPNEKHGIVHVKTHPIQVDETFDIQMDVITGVGENNKLNDEFNVYPNPAYGEIFIKGSNNDINTVKIFNYQGKVLKTVKINSPGVKNYKLNIENLGPGVYFMEIDTRQGTVVKKITKL